MCHQVPKASLATSRKGQTKDLLKNWDQNAFVFKYLEALFFFPFFFLIFLFNSFSFPSETDRDESLILLNA